MRLKTISIGVALVVFGVAIGAGASYWQHNSAIPVAATTSNMVIGGGPAGVILDGAPAGPDARGSSATIGTIQSVADKQLTLDGPNGSIKVQLTDSTAILKPTAGTLGSLKVGDSITALGKMDGETAMIATTIEAGAPSVPDGNQMITSGGAPKIVSGEPAGPSSTPTMIAMQALKGTVEALGANEITLKTADRSIKVTTNDSTKINVLQTLTKADLKSGTQVLVTGAKADDGTITATQVRVVEGKVVQKIQK